MTLALIAGPGGVPPYLVKCLLARGEVPLICETQPFASQIAGDLPRLDFRLEQVGSFLSELRARGIARLCMAGDMCRSPVDPMRMDAATRAYLPRLQAAFAGGDGGLMRALIEIVEEHGIAVLGAAEIAPDLLPGPGLQTGALRDTSAADVTAAIAALESMDGDQGAGGAVVVRAGRVMAQADARDIATLLAGLDAPPSGSGWTLDPFDLADQMIGGAADWLSGQDSWPEAGGILYIAPITGQEIRVNMPVIDPDIAGHAAAARLDGIVIEARGVMVLEPDALRHALAARQLFLWVRDPGRG